MTSQKICFGLSFSIDPLLFCYFQARAVLHRFRTRRKIPCTLQGLCILCGTGMWDSGHVPIIKCVGDHPEGVDNQCPYGGVVDNSSED